MLLNAAPVLVSGLATEATGDLADQFTATFTLVRLPLFVAVPLQSALVPLLTRLSTDGAAGALRRFVLTLAAGIAGLAVLGGLLGLTIGPPLVELLFGERYALPAGPTALLAVGSGLYLGLLVVSQALLASGLHRQVAIGWAIGLGAAGLAFALVPDLVLRAALGFTVGSGVALVWGVVVLLRRPPGRPPPSVPSPLPRRVSVVPDADLLIALNYYAPYVSGLTNVARDVAVGLVDRGHRVRVVTSRHDPALPEREELDGVLVERVPVVARLGKGVISPAFVPRVLQASRSARVTHLHLPMPEAGALALRVHSPLVVTYHCDVSLPPGLVEQGAGWGHGPVQPGCAPTGRPGRRDQPGLRRAQPGVAGHGRTDTVVPPPCHVRPAGRPSFRDGAGLHVGFLGRIVEEKGLQYLVQAFQQLGDPDARLLIGGDFAAVAGGSVVDQVRGLAAGDERIRFLGFLPEEQIADLYASIDVFALPSVNSFEAFGIVQVEAMMAGVPALASDLPGVRTPVQETGFGVVTTPRDVGDITAGLARLRDAALDRDAGAQRARDRYALDTVLDGYEDVLADVARESAQQ